MINDALSHLKWSGMTFFNSNIPSKNFYYAIDPEIICLARNDNHRFTFKMLIDKLLSSMSTQGSQERNIIILPNKMFGRHSVVFGKFATTYVNRNYHKNESSFYV